jgi:hypothetical protein
MLIVAFFESTTTHAQVGGGCIGFGVHLGVHLGVAWRGYNSQGKECYGVFSKVPILPAW